MEDNGWVNQDWAVFPDCRETMLEVQITGAPSAEYDTMYLNVWFDGNRNGEWGDTKPCEDAMLPPDDGNSGQPDDDGTVRPAGGDPAMGGTIAHEWAVQNFPVDVTSLQGDLKLYVPTFIVMNDMPDMPAWVRFTLSERPVDDSAMPFQHDGRGPQYPDRYELGETEDYLYFPPFDVPDNGVPGESGEIFLNKNATNFDGIDDVLVTSASVGDTFWYNVELKHEGGTDAAEVHLFDMLPEGVHIIDGPFVDLEDGVASPLWANVHGGFGMNDEVEWMGQIWPDSKINVRFEVAVDHCPFNPERMLFNKAEAWTLNGPAVNVIAEYNVAVQCDFLDQAEDPQIFLDKWIRVERADLPDMGNSGEFEFDEIDDEFNPVDFETEFQNDFGDNFELGEGDFWFDPRFDYVEEHSTAPGRDVFFQMVLGGFSPVRETVVVSDTMPAGLDALDVSADRGIVEIADGVMTWRGQIGSNTPPAFIKLRARPNEAAFCETTIKNVAVWRMRQPDGTVMSGESNEAKLKIICRDLGDAPDSFNHYGVEMEAYPGVKAEFPTVHKLSEADELRGPMHQEAKPFHLGRGVSREREADIGGDADGINNIMVWENRGDFDDYDDGISRYDIRMAHCEPTVLKVIVAIDEASMDKLLANEGFGYLNVWLDGDRNGSWADVHQCESGDRAPEHIIIDHGIDAFDLGAGIHEIEVETSVPVFWPEELSNQPAWARATLSERQSYKMLPEGCEIGSCRFGDGRGHPDFPFALGETEDYLVRPFDADGDIPTDGADPAVEKKGRLRIRENPRSGEEEWLAEWKVEYSNDGYGLAENVTVVDTMAGAQEIVSYSSFPPRTGNKVDNEITFSIGDMAPGQIGYINMRSTLPLNTPAGTVFTNTVTISADIDEVEDNNTVVVTMTVPLQAPIITYPLPGTTCTGTITVAGRAQPGVLVDLYIDGVQVTNTDGSTETEPITGTMALTDTVLMADENGRWSFGTTLVGDGEHTIYAVARTTSGVVSQPSSTVVAIVDSSIYWNPMSLRFYDDTGHVIIPRDEDGRLDEAGWGVPLRPGTTYTVTLEVCCDSPTRIVEMEIPGVDEDVLLTDTDNDNHFVGTFTTNEEGVAEGRLRVCVTCDLIQRCSDGTVLIDPEGTVFDLITGLEIDGAEVVCLERQSVGASNADGTDAIYSRWAAEDFNDQINPQIVGEDGYFSFFTPPGTFRLQVSKEGYYPYTSKDLVVVDEPVHFDVPLMPEIDLNSETGDIVILTIDENGFNPPLREIEPGTIVKFINLDTDAHSATSTMTESLTFNGSPSVVSAAGILATDAWDTGLIESGDEFVTKFAGTGTFTYYDAANPSNTATIVVKEGAEAPPADLATVGDEDDTDVPDPGDGGSGSNTLYLPFTAK